MWLLVPVTECTVCRMAQEVQEHFPGLVEEKQDGMLGLNYDGIAVLAIQAVKEQQVVIDTQNDRIAKLEAVVRELLQERSFD